MSTCKLCSNSYKTKGGNTSTITRHAQIAHPKEFKEAQIVKKQPTIQQLFSNPQYASGSARRLKLNRQVVKMIVQDMEPLSIVEKPGFKSLVQALDPKYGLPCRATVRGLIKEIFGEVCAKIVIELQSADHVAITTDMWSSVNMDSFNAVTIHYWSTDVNALITRILDCSHFEGRHTAGGLAKELTRVTENFKIETKISGALSDNAHNIGKAMKDLKLSHLPCYAHTLNLVVIDAIKAVPEVWELRCKVSKVVTHVKTSTIGKQKFKNCLNTVGIKDLNLLQDVPTRWNSLFLMFSRFLTLKDALVLFFSDETELAISLSDWQLLQNFSSILSPLYEATKEISEEKHTTVSKVIPMTKILTQFYSGSGSEELQDDSAKKFKKELLTSIQKRFGWIENNKIYSVSTLLDPRFKHLAFSSPIKMTQAKSWAIEEATRMAPREVIDQANAGQSLDEPPPKKVKYRQALIC